jgi:histidinol-phosphate phosphatase family protein
MPKKALFIDRDGVINLMAPSETEGFDSPQTLDQVELVPGVAEVIAFCNAQGVPVIEISNQPGAAKGKMTFEHLEAIEARVHKLLAGKGAKIDASYRCFHHPKATVAEFLLECDCRKPKPGLLLQAAQEMDIDLEKSLFLGDAASDMEAGQAARCKTLFYFHENDTPEKIVKKETYRGGDQAYVTDHKGTLAFVTSFFV